MTILIAIPVVGEKYENQSKLITTQARHNQRPRLIGWMQQSIGFLRPLFSQSDVAFDGDVGIFW